jgi:hypothetical protein
MQIGGYEQFINEIKLICPPVQKFGAGAMTLLPIRGTEKGRNSPPGGAQAMK